MKIAILTLHSAYNFGANLQAFTVTKYLLTKGHDVEVLDYRRVETRKRYQKRVPKEQWNAHERFINLLPLTKAVSNTDDLINVVYKGGFDLIIVGSDAVWNFPKTTNTIPAYFMDWLFNNNSICNIPVVSLSAANMSNGYRHLNPELRRELNKSITRFNNISVRDLWNERVIRRHLNVDNCIKITVNPDPVFGIGDFINDDWDNQNKIGNGQKFLLISSNRSKTILKWSKKFKEAANRRGYLVGELPLPEGSVGLDCDFRVDFPLDPIQWLLWLKNCDGYVGQRYHSVVTCITVGTPFFSIDTYGNSSTIIRVINRIGLYKLGRRFDAKSKIYNLLLGTMYSSFRVNSIGICGIRPKKLIDLLEGVDDKLLNELCFQNMSLFNSFFDGVLHGLAKKH